MMNFLYICKIYLFYYNQNYVHNPKMNKDYTMRNKRKTRIPDETRNMRLISS